MKILVLADIHGDMKTLDKVIESAGKDFDLVFCPGDFTDMFNTAKEFDQLDIAEIIVQKLLAIGKPVFALPGNHDPYEILEIFNEYGINIHDKHKEFGNINFIGFGGAATPFNTIFEPTEKEITSSLEKNSKPLKDFVLLLHMPPKATKVDVIEGNKHVGSQAIKDFILAKKPILAISAHIHESAAIDKVGPTTLFYPGPVYEGKYGIVAIDGKEVRCEIKKA